MHQEEKLSTVILAAGKGTRIQQITCIRPKHTLMLNGQSLISRACLLMLKYSDEIVIVAGANAAAIRPEVSGLPQNTIRIVGEEKISDQGCAASLKSGIRSLKKEVGNVLIIEGDLVITQKAVETLLAARAETRIATTSKAKKDDGKVYWTPELEKFVVKAEAAPGDQYFGKFTGMTLMPLAVARALEETIPRDSNSCCSDYIQEVCDKSIDVISLDEASVGEIDTADDYREILESVHLTTLIPGAQQIKKRALRGSPPLHRLTVIRDRYSAQSAQRHGFDGVWVQSTEDDSELEEKLEIIDSLQSTNFALPIVLEISSHEATEKNVDAIRARSHWTKLSAVCLRLDDECLASDPGERLSMAMDQLDVEVIIRVDDIDRGIDICKNLINERLDRRATLAVPIESRADLEKFNDYRSSRDTDFLRTVAVVSTYDIPLNIFGDTNFFTVLYPCAKYTSEAIYDEVSFQLITHGSIKNLDLKSIIRGCEASI